MQTVKLIDGPDYEPITLANAKGWLLIDDDITEHDTVIRMLIKAMREYAENRTFRAFMPRQYRLYSDVWPVDTDWGVKIELPYPPLRSVVSLKYKDTNGDLQTLAADQYVVHTEYEPGFIVPAWQVTFPSARRVPDSIQVVYNAGYEPGSPQDDEVEQQLVMPAALKTWMEARIATLFENREQLITGTIVAPLPYDYVDGLLDSLVVGTRYF